MRSYVTLVTSDSFIPGAITLAKSLHHSGCKFPIAVLVTDNVDCSTFISSGLFDKIVHVPVIPNPFNPTVNAWKKCGFSKLRIWSLDLVGYSKVFYIDADCVVLHNLDHVFELEDDFMAAPDVFPPDKFNAGVMLITPNSDILALMLLALPTLTSYDGGDTGFLNQFFPDWFYSTSRLPFGYNALRTLKWFTRSNSKYWDSLDPLYIVHFCSSPKPWEGQPYRDLDEIWIQASEYNPSTTANTKSLTLPTLILQPLNPPPVYFQGCKPVTTMKQKLWSDNDIGWLLQWIEHYNDSVEFYSIEECIPKVIHQIWFGGVEKIPDHLRKLMKGWENSGFRYKLWTEKDLLNWDFSGPISLEGLSFVEQSDIFRLEVLHKLGGIYVDIDMELLSILPIARLCDTHDFFVGCSNVNAIEINNAIVGASPGNHIVSELLSTIVLKGSGAKRTIESTGPGHYTRVLGKLCESLGHGVVLPATTFYPLPNCLRGMVWSEAKTLFCRRDSAAIHYWESTWIDQSTTTDVDISELISQKCTSNDPALITQNIQSFLE